MTRHSYFVQKETQLRLSRFVPLLLLVMSCLCSCGWLGGAIPNPREREAFLK